MKKTAIQSVLYKRHQTHQRDLVVLCQIIVLLGILLTLCFPTVIPWVSYVINNNIISIDYHIGWLIFALSFAILPITFALLTSQSHQLLITYCCAPMESYSTCTSDYTLLKHKNVSSIYGFNRICFLNLHSL